MLIAGRARLDIERIMVVKVALDAWSASEEDDLPNRSFRTRRFGGALIAALTR
jgi:hypothetical protein